MNRKSLPLIAGVALLALSLTGCESIKRALGIEKVMPDEFAVAPRAPLEVPPDFALRPPQPGAARTQETTPLEQARQSVFRVGDQQVLPPAEGQRSAGETALLRDAGAAGTPADIREQVSRDADQPAQVDSGLTDKLLFWRSSDVRPATDQPIDAQEEAQRLSDQKAAPKPTVPAPPAATPSGEPAPGHSFWDWLF